jgi:hypothetical protein
MSSTESNRPSARKANRKGETKSAEKPARKTRPNGGSAATRPATRSPADATADVPNSARRRSTVQPGRQGADAHQRLQAANDTTIAEVELSSTAEEWRRKVAEAAYYRAERRGFAGGTPEQDWIEAEEDLRRSMLDSGA